MIAVKIWIAVLLVAFLTAVCWLVKHQHQILRKLIKNGALPREAVRGNVLVLVVAAGTAIVGLLVHLLLS